MASLVVPWAAQVGVITARDFASDHRPPLPSELLASFVVFGFLAGIAIPAPKAATLAGWGIVLATVLASSTDFLGPVGDFLAGKPAAGSKPPVFFGQKPGTVAGPIGSARPAGPPTIQPII